MPAAARRRRVVVEADGGSRGNPGPAAYGAVLKDADTGAVIAADAEPIGMATNNVAEYRGLIAGLELARRHAPDAEVEVRMDSKLAIEQMAGRWKVKHAGLLPLAAQAKQLAAPVVRWTWVPRDRNVDADRLLNEALDAASRSRTSSGPLQWRGGGSSDAGRPTTLLLVTPGEGHEAAAIADWLADRHGAVAVLAAPLRPARDAGQVVAERLGLPLMVEDGLGDSLPAAGPSQTVIRRLRQLCDKLVRNYPGETVTVVAPTPVVAGLVGVALDVPPSAVHRIQPAPASVSVLCWNADGTVALRQLAVRP